jgi:hypothetical protein
MIYFLVTLYFAMLGPWLRLAPSHSLIVPAGVIGQTQAGASKIASNRGQAGDSAEKAACRRFVGEFYAWYVARSQKGDPLRAALRLKKANFSPELIRGLNEDARAARRSPGEIVGLDFDPVLNSQDFAEKYVPGTVMQKGSRFWVDVFSVYSGKRSDTSAVIPELRHEHGRWVFTNFLYKTDGKTDDLLSILKQLKADRKKSK